MKSTDDKLDDVSRELCHSKKKCEVCFKEGLLHWHHYLGRRIKVLRWCRENWILCCPEHHKMGKQSFHEDPEWGREWMIANRPEDHKYCIDHRNDAPLKKWQKIELHNELKQQLKELLNG
jgi:hypothetical protein